MVTTRRIAFLYLGEIHHLHHFLGIAIQMQKLCDVSILTYKSNHDYLSNYLHDLGGDQAKIEELPTLAFRAFTDKIKKRTQPRKLFWLKKNKTYLLENFDGIVFTDYFHQYLLKKRTGKSKPKFIKLPHGTPGRSYSYQKKLLDFDFVLLLGEFHKRTLEDKKLLGENYAVVGFPKLDVIQPNPKVPAFKNNRPTVLYNPHFSTPLSSWFSMGLDVLEFFFNQDKYNLIFAPHLNLFKKKFGGDISSIPEKYQNAEHIHLDFGSKESINMTYVQNSDIYLGDVSSQVYEFIISPRPCIFLNPCKVSYQKDINFRFWQCGEVINELRDLKSALENSERNFYEFEEIQKKITSENFYSEKGTTASERAADAILSYLNKSFANL